MNKLHKNLVKNYETACQNIAKEFIKTYYVDKDIPFSDVDWSWIGDEIGGIIGINDEFWCVDNMKTALELGADKEKLFKWYYDSVEAYDKKEAFPNLSNYIQYVELSK